MEYASGETLLPLRSEELRALPRVPFQDLPSLELLVYDREVSNFFFEFEPAEDIERFLFHAHFACRTGPENHLLACREDLHILAECIWQDTRFSQPLEIAVPMGGQTTIPLVGVPHEPAYESLLRDGNWKGRISCCSCGIPGCESQYAWFVRGMCLFLFTISGASLVQVDCLPFRFRGFAESDTPADRPRN